MNPILAIGRRWLRLPAPRFRTALSREWVPLSDGTRLATAVVRPRGASAASTLLLRTSQPAHAAAHPALVFARLLAEQGHAVVVQECRGRHESEGTFRPFADEARDGAESIDWIGKQSWFEGRLGLVGFGYSGFSAWASLSRTRERVDALLVGFAGRDPYRWFYRGGALQLEFALAWGLGVGERGDVPERSIDLERGADFRPVREADRVALRTTDWYRDWVDHPERDAFWEALSPPIPESPPATLIAAGWHHPALDAQLDDYESLCGAASQRDGASPELLIGPWGAIRPVRPERRIRGARALSNLLLASFAFFDRHLRGARGDASPVRWFVRGADRWRESATWPAPGAVHQDWFLHGDGRANGSDGDGRLDRAAPQSEEPSDGYVYDPACAVPTRGGATVARPSGPVDQGDIDWRGDVLSFTSAPLVRSVELAGPVVAVLFVASDAPDTDFTAKLVDVAPDGAARHVCDGVLRCRRRPQSGASPWLEHGRTERIDVELSAVGHRFEPGHRLRLGISSSNFPRFDRNPNTSGEPARVGDGDCRPARQTLYHDAERPSQLRLLVLERE